MRLSSAAKFYDKQTLTDAYGTATIKGQFDLFDDGKRDGVVSRRRILSVAPAVEMPARNALSIDGQVWLVGSSNTDYHMADPIRRKYVLHEADGLASVQTLAQFLAASGGSTAYAALEWVKAAKEVDESSDLADQMTVVFARTEALPALGIITLGGANYLLREPHQSAAGFQAGPAEDLKVPVTEQGSFTGRTYDPVGDTWTGAGIPVSFLRLRWQVYFRFISARTLHYEAGDSVLVCLKTAATPKTNDQITLTDGLYQVLTVQSDNDCWSCHVRLIQA